MSIRDKADREPSEVNFCDQCAGPYPLDSWPGSQYAGHWDTCPNRHHAAPVGHPSDAEVEAAAGAIVEASFGQELPEAPIDLARAALLAAQEVRRAD